eukprot:2376109-Rhodomonas_salina.4
MVVRETVTHFNFRLDLVLSDTGLQLLDITATPRATRIVTDNSQPERVPESNLMMIAGEPEALERQESHHTGTDSEA